MSTTSTTEERLADFERRLRTLEQNKAVESGCNPNAAVRAQWDAISQEEKDAGWWRYEPRMINPALKMHLEKTEKHPDNNRHALVQLEWDKVKADPAFSIWSCNSVYEGWQRLDREPTWQSEFYKIRNDAQNAFAPKKKLIDKSKLPIGVMTNYGELVGIAVDGHFVCLHPSMKLMHVSKEDLRIVPMTEWIHWTGGDESPVPSGLFVQLERCGEGRSYLTDMFSQGIDWSAVNITGYRVAGIQAGYTDDESEAA